MAIAYLLFGLVGVGLMVFINWRMKGVKEATLGCANCALRELTAEDPAFEMKEAALTVDKHAALVLSTEDTLHLVRAQGDKFVTRKLDPKLLTVKADGATLLLHAANDTADDAKLVFADAGTTAVWAARLSGGRAA